MKYYVVDAFTREVFKGNPAGVCILDKPLDDAVMQKIAFENNLAETAFIYEQAGVYSLRWFSPRVEMDLCGHATLAAAHVMMSFVNTALGVVQFSTKSGLLTVVREGRMYKIDFPRRPAVPCAAPPLLQEALGCKVLETHIARDLIVLVEDEAAVRAVTPDFAKLVQIPGPVAIVVTAKSDTADFDFVSRVFAPSVGVNEDPASGATHATLIPFWAERLGKSTLVSAQLSERGGVLYGRDFSRRIEIGGEAVCYLSGSLLL